MILKIETDFKISKSFLKALRRYMKNYFFLILDYKELKKYEKKINDLKLFSSDLSLLDIYMKAFANIKFNIYGNKYTLYIDDNVLYKDIDIKLDSLCNLITAGSMDFEGYPILKDVFIHFENNIKRYRDKFMRGMGVF